MSHPLNETTFSARVLKDEQQAAWVVYFMAKPGGGAGSHAVA